MENINFDVLYRMTGKLSDRLTVKRLAGYDETIQRKAIDAQFALRQAMADLALCAAWSEPAGNRADGV
jgi:hypothetical protein